MTKSTNRMNYEDQVCSAHAATAEAVNEITILLNELDCPLDDGPMDWGYATTLSAVASKVHEARSMLCKLAGITEAELEEMADAKTYRHR